MTDPFATALLALFNAAGSVAAVYPQSDSPAIAVRAIKNGPDQTASFGTVRVIQSSKRIELMVIEVSRPVNGALVSIGGTIVDGNVAGGELLQLFGDPMLDSEGLTWMCGAEPYDP